MKVTNIIASIALVGLLGAGVFASVSSNIQQAPEEVAADIDVNYGTSGKVFLQLNTSTWRSTDAKIGLYMFKNGDGGGSAWGDLVTPSSSSRFVEYSYNNLSFTPEGCIAFRVTSATESIGSWCFENNRGNAAILSTTDDITFNNVVWLGEHYENSKWTQSGSYNLDAVVKGGASDNWSVATIDQRLTDVKVNDSDNLEVYGKITLAANTYFKVVKGGSTWCGGYTPNALVADNLENSASGNIHNTAKATYEIFFDYDGESSYITDPVLADADKWSQSFLSTVGCDPDGIDLPTGWSTCASSYASLDGDVKDYIYAASANVGGTSTEQAVARYDLARKNHPSLSNFIVDSHNTPRTAHLAPVSGIVETNNTTAIIIIVAVSLVSISAIGGYFFLRKRKED